MYLGVTNIPSKFRDVDHPGEDMGALYASEVKGICDKLAAGGEKPGCFIARS